MRYSDIGDAVVPYDGVPFIILARHERWCMFGKDQHIAQKEKKLQAQENEKQARLICFNPLFFLSFFKHLFSKSMFFVISIQVYSSLLVNIFVRGASQQP